MSHPEHFFKYCTPKVAKLVLSTKKVRWNSPLNFDDPFDCYFSLEPKFDLREALIKQRILFFDLLCQVEEPPFVLASPFVGAMKNLRRATKGKPRKELESLFADVFDKAIPAFEQIAQTVRDEWRTRMKDYRLFCVCEINDNLLLWSKYTANHSGVVFQFECIKDLDVPLLAAKQVTYSDEGPAFATEQEWIESFAGLRAFPTGDGVWLKQVTTKAKAWEQEKEWRVVTVRRPYENNGYEDCTFCPEEISKVFFGCKMDDTDKAELLNLLSGPFAHVEVYQAKQNPLKYKLDFERIK